MRVFSRARLRRLALFCLAATTLALMALVALGLRGWQQTGASLAEVQTLEALHGDLRRMQRGVDYLTLLQAEPGVARGIAGDAQRLGAALDTHDEPAAARARGHLREIAHLAGAVAENRVRAGPADARSAEVLLDVSRQLRTHMNVVDDSLYQLSRDSQRQARGTLQTLIVRFMGLVLGLGLVSLAAFGLIHWRLAGPLRTIESGLDALARGHLDTRIDVRTNDELGEIADSFNHMAEERQLIEDYLAESEERFRLFASATTDAVWDLDLRNDTLWWGEGFEKLFGHSRDGPEASFAGWQRLLHPDDAEATLDSLKAAMDGNSSRWKHAYRLRRADGSYAYVIDRGFLIRDADGTAQRMVGGITDLSERVGLEQQLRESQRLEAVGQLTGGVAHDFNNLLTVILGNAELLSEQLRDDRQRGPLAEMIASAAQRGADLTRHLLAFARKQALVPVVTDVNRLLTDMEQLLRRTLGEHIELELARGAGLWPTLVDPAQLESALLNLCLNARDAMPEGGRLTVETGNAHLDQAYADSNVDVHPGQYAMLAVSDTGTGIPPGQLLRVFEPFFSTKEKGKGTGLGLSMVYGFIKQSGGHIKVYSEPGQGTTVRLYLPRHLGEAAERRPFSVERSTRGSGEVILVVEDDTLVRQHVVAQLERLGYAALEADTGQAALDILQERHDIALLFTDIVMPGGMNGRELVDAALALRPGLKVLYTSGYTENAVAHHGRLDPGVRLLAKPFRRAELARRLQDTLYGS